MGDDVDQVPKDKTERLKWLDKQSRELFARTAERFRGKLVKTLGPEVGTAVKYAEAFEVCEYGSQPTAEELARIFPFVGKRR